MLDETKQHALVTALLLIFFLFFYFLHLSNICEGESGHKIKPKGIEHTIKSVVGDSGWSVHFL